MAKSGRPRPPAPPSVSRVVRDEFDPELQPNPFPDDLCAEFHNDLFQLLPLDAQIPPGTRLAIMQSGDQIVAVLNGAKLAFLSSKERAREIERCMDAGYRFIGETLHMQDGTESTLTVRTWGVRVTL